VDVELTATFVNSQDSVSCRGFYAGDGRFVVRMMATRLGEWSFRTTSNVPALDGVTGAFTVTAAEAGRHGPVRTDGFHFIHADGARYRPWGTTAYAWIHQPAKTQDQTIAALASAPFNKLRMCLLPKSYVYTRNEPTRFPFPRAGDGFDLTRFDTDFFDNLEFRIAQLARLGIVADVILFHPYDRWGFADLGAEVDDRLITYTVSRLAAFANVWWALANEYDLVTSKTDADWERLAARVGETDPYGHPLSIHNCHTFFDHARPWISHASIQRIDVYRTAENVTEWRQAWRKPVVVDEAGYEGDIEFGWGNLRAEELVRRCWEGAVRGGYVGHGETYLNPEERLWWSKGGTLTGQSPARIAFLAQIVAASPSGVLEPCPSEWDVPWGGVPGRYLVGYLGAGQSRHVTVRLPPGRFRVDVIDTWDMTVNRLDHVFSGEVEVPLPGKPYMAIRAIADPSAPDS
jgi:hypothetical protein